LNNQQFPHSRYVVNDTIYLLSSYLKIGIYINIIKPEYPYIICERDHQTFSSFSTPEKAMATDPYLGL
jgi:hypothetical protein